MKIGFFWREYNDLAHMLYILQNSGKLISFENANKQFKIFTGKDMFIFSSDSNDLKDCDKKIRLCHNTWRQIEDPEIWDKIILSTIGEPPHGITDQDLLDFLDKGNIYLFGGITTFSHKNIIADPMFNLSHFYYCYGFNYLNYYQSNRKNNLLGAYHRHHISDIKKADRDLIFNIIKDELGDDLFTYSSPVYFFQPILEKYYFFGFWGNNHITSYTDYATSTCNIIFETWSYTSTGKFVHITEKTLKSIIFCEENIFFIWIGQPALFRYLTKLGFWFLNSEFYNMENLDNSDNSDNMKQSAIDSSTYLKQLKEELISNDLVHEYLMNKYGHKLKNNVAIFKNVLNTCNKQNQYIDLIKGKNEEN